MKQPQDIIPPPSAAVAETNAGRARQVIKIVVYSLLVVNYAVYIADDYELARHTAMEDWGLLDWAGAYATTLATTAA